MDNVISFTKAKWEIKKKKHYIGGINYKAQKVDRSMDDERKSIYRDLYLEFYDLREAINTAFVETVRVHKSYKNYFGEQVDQRQLEKITDITFTRTTEFENRIKEISNLFQALHALDKPKRIKKPNCKEQKGLKLIVSDK